MNISEWSQVSFDAGHAADCPNTTGFHGHRYLIRAYIHGPYDPKRPSLIDEVRLKLADIRTELQGTVIDQMLPGVTTTKAGIAAWVLERIPSAWSVWVGTDSDQGVEVYR